MAKYCQNCGQELEEGVRFCPSCGAKIAVEEPAPAQEESQYYQEQPRRQQEEPQQAYRPYGEDSLKDKFLSFQGRLNRKPYIIRGIIIGVISSLLSAILESSAGDSAIFAIIAIVAAVLIIWVSFSLGVRRWHDLNHSGWWMLLALIPVVNICATIYLIFARGTKGPNDYGDDPLDFL